MHTAHQYLHGCANNRSCAAPFVPCIASDCCFVTFVVGCCLSDVHCTGSKPVPPSIYDMFSICGECFNKRHEASALAAEHRNHGFISITPLLASHISELDLHAACCVLNCCNSGRGVITSDGLEGLASGFLAAGVASAIVCLWSVLETTSGDIAEDIYAQLGEGTHTSGALQFAMIKALRKGVAPREWSAFALYGPSVLPMRVLPEPDVIETNDTKPLSHRARL